VDLGNLDQAKTYTQQVISIIDDMGHPDYMAFSYPVYLFLGDLDTACDLALKYLIYESKIYNIGFLRALIWTLVVRNYEKYGYRNALQNVAERFWDIFGDELREAGATHLTLEKADIETPLSVEIMEDFSQDSLPSNWEWRGLRSNNSYQLLKPGIELNVSAAFYYHQHPSIVMETSGDFMLETCLRNGSQGRRSGGLFVWKDEDNSAFLSVLSRVFNYNNSIFFQVHYKEKETNPCVYYYAKEKAWLRLERKGERFTGYISDDGETWYCCGYADLPLEDAIQVGLFADCSYYPSTSTRFEYFKIYRPE